MPLPSRWEGLAEQGSHPDRQCPPSSGQCWPQSPARAFEFYWISGGGARAQGQFSLCRSCGFRMDTYFLTKPQSCLAWFCGCLHHTTGNRDSCCDHSVNIRTAITKWIPRSQESSCPLGRTTRQGSHRPRWLPQDVQKSWDRSMGGEPLASSVSSFTSEIYLIMI